MTIDLRARVTSAVADVLAAPPEAVAGAESLFDLDGFDSITVVAVLERLEGELHIEVDPDDIVPEAFDNLDALTGLIGRAQSTTSTGGIA